MIRKYLDGGATKADDGKANVAMPLHGCSYMHSKMVYERHLHLSLNYLTSHVTVCH